MQIRTAQLNCTTKAEQEQRIIHHFEMPKKKKGGKKKGKKGGKKKEEEMTPGEAILVYRINVLEKQLGGLKFELASVQEKRDRNLERNERLSEERQEYIKMLLRKAQQLDNEADGSFVDKPEVVEQMKRNWQREGEEIALIKQLQSDVLEKDKRLNTTLADLRYWQEYRDSGSENHKKYIQVLTHEVKDMEETFTAMSNYIEKKLDKEKNEINELSNAAIDQQKDAASERAMNQLDKHSRQEVVDNEWLHKEVAIHRAELQKILSAVENIERQNLTIMSELFECGVEDLKVSRNFFMTQCGDEDLEKAGILGLDLHRILPYNVRREQKADSLESLRRNNNPKRPKSAALQAAEDKFLSIANRIAHDSDEEISEIDSQFADDEDVSDENRFEKLDPFAAQDWGEELLNLGPLELKMLRLEGQRFRLNTPPMLTAEEVEARQWNPEEWPVTREMMRD